MKEIAKRLFAVIYGITCHLLFAAAVGLMFWSFCHGMQTGRGPLQGLPALLVNAVLLLQFPLIHSFFLGKRGRRMLANAVPGLGRDLITTTYVIVASLQLLLVFAAWNPSGVVWYRAQGAGFAASCVLFGLAWALLLKSMADAGLGLQTGALGWLAVARKKKPQYPPMPTGGLFRWCRQPIYASFALILWTGPVWSPDQLAIACAWTAYTLFGPRLKERRFLMLYGEAFRKYQQSVPYWAPLPKALRQLHLPAPLAARLRAD